ncbi:exonuclease ABC C subunit [Vibrio phage VCPH]|nr:exonuclease ABC C subunit [Vibrio phage VCPH]
MSLDQTIVITNDEQEAKWLTPTGRIKRTAPTEAKTAVFIYRAKKIHGNKYDYSLSVYGKTNKDKVTVICPEHGVFLATPHDHVGKGHGCKRCSTPKADVLYVWRVDRTNIIKVGVTSYKRYLDRVTEVAYSNRVTPVVMYIQHTPDAEHKEKNIIESLREFRYTGFTGKGKTEFFELPDNKLTELLLELHSLTGGD